MFTIEDANQLKDSLAEIDFVTPVSSDQATQSYIKHYGLDFDSENLTVTHYLGSYSSGRFNIACQYFAPPIESQIATVVLVHGYYDHVGLYGHLIKHCLNSGYSVLTFDLPGHGLSNGVAASINNFDRYSEALADCLALANQHGLTKPWFVVGQSTGAAAIINYLLKEQQFSQFHFDKIIFLAPLIKPRGWIKAILFHFLFRLFVKKIKRDFSPNSHDKNFSQFIAEKDPLQSRFLSIDWVNALKHYLADFSAASRHEAAIHVVQGTDDGTVDWQHNLPRLLEKFPNMKTYLIEDAQHHMVNEAEDIRAQIFAELDSILTLPESNQASSKKHTTTDSPINAV